MKKTTREMQLEHSIWAQKNFGDRDPYSSVLGVMEEVGELCHAMLKMKQGIRGSKEKHMASIKDAIGDIQVYLMDVCTGFDLDYHDCLEETWNQVMLRDWTKNKRDGQVLNSNPEHSPIEGVPYYHPGGVSVRTPTTDEGRRREQAEQQEGHDVPCSCGRPGCNYDSHFIKLGS
jgi:NTP pyrophosphatase (non-canonical NTP hydrolase)